MCRRFFWLEGLAVCLGRGARKRFTQGADLHFVIMELQSVIDCDQNGFCSAPISLVPVHTVAYRATDIFRHACLPPFQGPFECSLPFLRQLAERKSFTSLIA